MIDPVHIKSFLRIVNKKKQYKFVELHAKTFPDKIRVHLEPLPTSDLVWLSLYFRHPESYLLKDLNPCASCIKMH